MPTFKSRAERRSFWKQHVIACNDSGLSKAGYCREHQLAYHQLIYWLSQFEPQPAVCADPKPQLTASNRTSRLLPVVLRDHQQMQTGGIQITLPNGVVITGITEQHVSVALQLVNQL